MTNTYSSSTGLLTSSTDQSGNVTSVTWDGQRRVASVTTPLGTTTLTSDPVSGQVATVTDPNSNTTTLTSDPVANVVNMATPDGHSSSWTVLPTRCLPKLAEESVEEYASSGTKEDRA